MSVSGISDSEAAALAYHEATKHSFESVRSRRHFFDWANQPHPFKVFDANLPRISLPQGQSPVGMSALDAIGGVPRDPPVVLDLGALSRILSYGAGVIRKMSVGGGKAVYFRTYACAGALYPVEVYVVSAALPGLTAGVYHFDPLHRVLTALREGDHQAYLVRAAAGEPALSAASTILVLTGMPWRTTWKYTERGYRHLWWDSGMILANLLALAGSAGIAARVICGFVDSEVETLLGLDARAEFPLGLLSLGRGGQVPASGDPPPSASFPFRPLSGRQIEYPTILEVNDAGRLRDASEVAAWRARGFPEPVAPTMLGGPTVPVERALPVSDSLEAVIRRRGSARIFDREPVPAGVAATIWERATRGSATDLAPDGSRPVTLYLIANALEGLAPGAYVVEEGGLRVLAEGSLRREAGYLCLEQALGADAAATFFLATDLARILPRLGARGYRVGQLEAGIVAGKIYLGAYAYRLGATGLTFYDDDVTTFFSPHAGDPAGARTGAHTCMLVVAMGRTSRRLLPLA
ncbi:MAG: SagB/ThcOx family dehydrogenase [Actinomycetota bacterium]